MICFYHGSLIRRFATRFRCQRQLKSELSAELGLGNGTRHLKNTPMGEGADLGFFPLAPAIALPKDETLLTGNLAQGTQQRNPGLT